MKNFILKEKLSSGRFFLTITSALCFLMIVFTLMKILEKKSDDIDVNQIILLVTNVGLIIQNVFNSYFNKRRPEEIDEERPKPSE